MNNLLAKCYENLRPLLTSHNLGFPPEPVGTIKAVDAHRQYWKPKRVRILLLAESHVYTSENVALSHEDLPIRRAPPAQFVRLVYCLAYGEKSLPLKRVSNNGGTWQFWKILRACAKRPDAEVLKKEESSDKPRISNKIGVLTELRRSGVWLQDASIVALYHKGKKPSKRIREQILSQCWTDYILPTILQEKPEKVIAIGEHVFQTLKQQPSGEIVNDYVKQPQGCRNKGEFESELRKLQAML